MSISLALAVFALQAAGGMDVRGDSACPPPSEVGTALVGLVAPVPAPAAPDVVEITGAGDSVTLRLWNAAHQLLAERRVPPSPSCAERARAAAVIVAAWEAHLRAGAAPMWPLPPGAPAPASPPLPRPDAPPVAARPATPPPPAPVQVETRAAVLVSVAAGDVAPAALLEARLTRRGSRLAVGIGVLAVGAHSIAVASGRGSWHRFGGVVDLQSTAAWQTLALQLHAGLALAAVSIVGESLPVTDGATILDPGALAGLRLGLRGHSPSPWLEAAAAYWPRSHTLYVAGSTASQDLPLFEALLGVGISFGEDR
jgi:hypothetical protein